jgi:hypothetical protein
MHGGIQVYRESALQYLDVHSLDQAADAGNGRNAVPVGLLAYNGATWDRLRADAAKNLCVAVTGSGGQGARVELPADGNALTTDYTLYTQAVMTAYNASGNKKELCRNNTEGTLLGNAARTASATSADQTNYNARGVALLLNVNINPGGARTLQLTVQAKDPVGGVAYCPMAQFAASDFTSSPQVFLVYPGAEDTLASAVVSQQALPLPRTWRVVVTPSDAASWTYTVGYAYVL